MYIDTHLHLDEPWLSDENHRQKAIHDITKHQIITFAQSCDIKSYKKILEYSEQSEFIFPSFGILPWYAHEYVDRFEEVRELCEEALMLGEIGLDEKNARDKACIPHQRPLFEIFLETAEKHDMILNLHFRGTEDEGFEILNSYNVKKPIFHFYSGSLDLMEKINDKGYYYSMGQMNLERVLGEPKDPIIDKIRKIPDDLLLLEIDVLPRGQNFEVPSIVFVNIVNNIAKIRNTTSEEIEALNQKNVVKLVGNDPKLKKIIRLMESVPKT
ncbi:MAG: TatD family hydrolase [Candidatus Heimdallarchaeota archaeon]|nr:MAG: TatD family hydrolase [Candidatus Heimdallarchaeota archaeon]